MYSCIRDNTNIPLKRLLPRDANHTTDANHINAHDFTCLEVMKTANLFSCEHHGLSITSCLISPDFIERSNTQQQVLLLGNKHRDFTVLKIVQDKQIDSADCVAHQWIFALLGIVHSSTVLVEPLNVVSTQSDSAILVDLEFVGVKSNKHWDEMAHNGSTISFPGAWSRVWPADLKSAIVEQQCSIVLIGVALCTDAIIAMQIFDSLMVSEILISALFDLLLLFK